MEEKRANMKVNVKVKGERINGTKNGKKGTKSYSESVLHSSEKIDTMSCTYSYDVIMT